jgi:shikimate kinase
MTGLGEAVAHGAATIVNAIATGKGAAFGVDLWTRASVRLTDDCGVVQGRILSDPKEDTALINEVVKTVLQHFRVDDKFGAMVETESNIPIARGLKSSSVASNALVLAVTAALGEEITDIQAINLGVDASIRAKITITGAFDDACASFFGDVVVTDNFERKLLRTFRIKDDFTVTFGEALSGHYWNALTMNGVLYSAALGYNPKIALEAVGAGAVASGLSGTGPATVAVVPREDADEVLDAWRSYEGEVIQAGVNHSPARITRVG